MELTNQMEQPPANGDRMRAHKPIGIACETEIPAKHRLVSPLAKLLASYLIQPLPVNSSVTWLSLIATYLFICGPANTK